MNFTPVPMWQTTCVCRAESFRKSWEYTTEQFGVCISCCISPIRSTMIRAIQLPAHCRHTHSKRADRPTTHPVAASTPQLGNLPNALPFRSRLPTGQGLQLSVYVELAQFSRPVPRVQIGADPNPVGELHIILYATLRYATMLYSPLSPS